MAQGTGRKKKTTMNDAKAELLPLQRVRNRRTGRVVFYVHPHGYRIKREERDWDARGLGGMAADPKVYWEVKRRGRRHGRTFTFRTLRESREWCDQH